MERKIDLIAKYASENETITGTPNITVSPEVVAIGPRGPQGPGADPATSSTYGTIKLAGELGGTAAAPTLKNIIRVFNVIDYGATVGADITEIINELIATANAAGGGFVHVPDGVFYADPTIGVQMADNVTLYLAANATLKVPDGHDADGHFLRVEGVTNAHVYGGNLDGNRANQTGSTNYGLYFGGSERCSASNIRIDNFAGVGLQIYNSDKIGIINVWSEGHMFHGFEFEQARNCSVNGYWGNDNDLDGLMMNPGEIGGTGSYGNTVNNFHCWGNGRSGLAENAANGDISAFKNGTNIFSNFTLGGNGAYNLQLYKQDGQVFENGLIQDGQKIGLYLFQSAHNQFTNVRLINNSQEGNGSYAEVRMEGAATGHASTGNVFTNLHVTINGAIKASYAISEDTGDGGNTYLGLDVPAAGSIGTYSLQSTSRLGHVDNYSAQTVAGLKTFTNGIAIAPNATLPGGVAGFDMPFGNAAFRMFSDVGNLQFVAPNGNLDMYLGGNNVFSVTSTYATLHGYPLKAVDAGIDPTDAVNLGQLNIVNNGAVHITGTETITGAKTFTSTVTAQNAKFVGGTTTDVLGSALEIVRNGVTVGRIDNNSNGLRVQAQTGSLQLRGTGNTGISVDSSGNATFAANGTFSGTSVSIVNDGARMVLDRPTLATGTVGFDFRTNGTYDWAFGTIVANTDRLVYSSRLGGNTLLMYTDKTVRLREKLTISDLDTIAPVTALHVAVDTGTNTIGEVGRFDARQGGSSGTYLTFRAGGNEMGAIGGDFTGTARLSMYSGTGHTLAGYFDSSQKLFLTGNMQLGSSGNARTITMYNSTTALDMGTSQPVSGEYAFTMPGLQILNGRFDIVTSGGKAEFRVNGTNPEFNIYSTSHGANLFRAKGGTGAYTQLYNNVGLGTSAPTHSITLSSTTTGQVFYNTSDQTVDFERARMAWGSNTFTIRTELGGTGVARTLQFSSDGGGASLAISAQYIFSKSTGSTNFGAGIISQTGTYNQSSGSVTALGINPTINQTSTAGYIMLLINPTETAVGSGSKRLIDAQVGSASKFVVNNAGSVLNTGYMSVGSVSAPTNTTNGDLTALRIFANTITLGTPQTYTISNVTTDRSFDANSTTLDEVADTVGTLIADLRTAGIVL